MTAHATDGNCAWCALPKSKKGIILGIVASLALHLAAVGVIVHVGQDESEVKLAKEVRVIDLGTIVIHAPQKHVAPNQVKEI